MLCERISPRTINASAKSPSGSFASESVLGFTVIGLLLSRVTVGVIRVTVSVRG